MPLIHDITNSSVTFVTSVASKAASALRDRLFPQSQSKPAAAVAPQTATAVNPAPIAPIPATTTLTSTVPVVSVPPDDVTPVVTLVDKAPLRSAPDAVTLPSVVPIPARKVARIPAPAPDRLTATARASSNSVSKTAAQTVAPASTAIVKTPLHPTASSNAPAAKTPSTTINATTAPATVKSAPIAQVGAAKSRVMSPAERIHPDHLSGVFNMFNRRDFVAAKSVSKKWYAVSSLRSSWMYSRRGHKFQISEALQKLEKLAQHPAWRHSTLLQLTGDYSLKTMNEAEIQRLQLTVTKMDLQHLRCSYKLAISGIINWHQVAPRLRSLHIEEDWYSENSSILETVIASLSASDFSNLTSLHMGQTLPNVNWIRSLTTLNSITFSRQPSAESENAALMTALSTLATRHALRTVRFHYKAEKSLKSLLEAANTKTNLPVATFHTIESQIGSQWYSIDFLCMLASSMIVDLELHILVALQCLLSSEEQSIPRGFRWSEWKRSQPDRKHYLDSLGRIPEGLWEDYQSRLFPRSRLVALKELNQDALPPEENNIPFQTALRMVLGKVRRLTAKVWNERLNQVQEVLNCCARLNHLTLKPDTNIRDSNHLYSAPVLQASYFSSLNNLQTLQLAGCFLAIDWKPLASLQQLRLLTMDVDPDSQLSAAKFKILAALPCFEVLALRCRPDFEFYLFTEMVQEISHSKTWNRIVTSALTTPGWYCRGFCYESFTSDESDSRYLNWSNLRNFAMIERNLSTARSSTYHLKKVRSNDISSSGDHSTFKLDWHASYRESDDFPWSDQLEW